MSETNATQTGLKPFDLLEFSNDARDTYTVDVTPRQAAYLSNLLGCRDIHTDVDSDTLWSMFDDVALDAESQ